MRVRDVFVRLRDRLLETGDRRRPAWRAPLPDRAANAASRPDTEAPEILSVPAIREGPFALRIIAVILICHTLYFAAPLLAPIAFAVLLSMLFAPLVSGLERLHVPRSAGAATVVLAAMGTAVLAVVLLAGPAQNWIERAPDGLRRIEEKIAPLKRALSKATEHLQEATQGATPDNAPQRVVIVRPALADFVLGSPHFITPALSVFILVFFLLAAGDVFLRKLVTIIPTFKEKKRTVEIIRAIEDDISYYLLTFAAVNVGLGIVMGLVTAVLGISNPLLWGTLVAILNFIPYIGSVASMIILTMVGFMSFDSVPMALAAPASMLALSALSAEIVTPLVLGRALRLNPVAIFIAILFWGWMWGIVGVLLAVPLLATVKIVCERLEPLASIAKFLTQYDEADET